jgi:hypothetical protein
MKKLIVLFCLSFACLFINSCNTTEPETKIVDYTYSIIKAVWEDSVDANGDGYATNRNLLFQVRIAESVKREINARIYYKPQGGSNYTFYGQTSDYTIEGYSSALTIEYPIGPPLKELNRGIYNFMIEIFEKGGTRLEASLSAEDSLGKNLRSQKFESLSTDQIYSVNVWWRKIFDNNKNGYAQTAIIGIDVNIDKNVKKDIFVTLFKKKTSETNYTSYKSGSTFSITYKDKKDSINIDVGTKINGELEQGLYDFQVIVYESKTQNVVAVLNPEKADTLGRRKFETRDEDSYYYTINTTTLKWTDSIDVNKNGYTYARKFFIDVDVDKNDQREIYASVYYVHEDSTNGDSTEYNEYFKLPNTTYKIFGQSPLDAISLDIGKIQDSTRFLFKGRYNFIINFYEKGDSSIIATLGGNNNALLKLQKFESFKQDTTKVK